MLFYILLFIFLEPSDAIQNLTYTIADVPSQSLFDNQVSSAAGDTDLGEMALAALKSDQGREKLVRFFKTWLEIKEASELSGFEATLPSFDQDLANDIVDETNQFLRNQIRQLSPSLKKITQSQESFINQNLNQIYNNTNVSETGAVQLNASQRLGVFTQSSFIASHSGPEDTRLVKRGVFFTRKVMCVPIGSLPDGADINLPPEDGTLTERQRIETATNQSSCAGCHRYINPFGFIQENYNPLGQWRTEDKHDLPINSSISIDFLDSTNFQSSDPVESLRHFTDSMQFKQCFVKQLFRYYNGRMESSRDNALLRKMFFYFALNDNQNLLDLLEMMTTSSHFYMRSNEDL